MTQSPTFLASDGFCPLCQREAHFQSPVSWLRDHFVCDGCGSIPRERALIAVIDMLYPHWRSLEIHETSPSMPMRGASRKLLAECQGYTYSYYDSAVPLGENLPDTGFRCENIEKMTFPECSFDLFLSQDVFEHIFHPAMAIKEIARTLKPGGAAIMSVPLVRKSLNSERRAALLSNDEIEYLKPAEYHGNAIDDGTSLVTIDWGYDIASYLTIHSGLPSWIVYIDDLSRGIKAEFIEVVVVQKITAPSL